jgi:type I restriction enzyme, S subunit
MERVGVAVFVETTRARLMFPDTVFRTRAVPSDALLPRFLVAAMQSEAVQKHWWQRKVGLADAQVNINHGIVRNTPFQLPQRDEQNRILSAISTYEAIQRDYERELPKLKSAKSGLMQDLLTGTVSVAPLLERAAA